MIGSGIYILNCPSIIRDNQNYGDFRQQGKNIDHLALVAEEFEMESGELWNWLEQNEEHYRRVHIMINDSHDSDYQVRDVYWHLQKHADRANPKIRVSIQVLFFVAIVLMGYVFSQNILTVALYSLGDNL